MIPSATGSSLVAQVTSISYSGIATPTTSLKQVVHVFSMPSVNHYWPVVSIFFHMIIDNFILLVQAPIRWSMPSPSGRCSRGKHQILYGNAGKPWGRISHPVARSILHCHVRISPPWPHVFRSRPKTETSRAARYHRALGTLREAKPWRAQQREFVAVPCYSRRFLLFWAFIPSNIMQLLIITSIS